MALWNRMCSQFPNSWSISCITRSTWGNWWERRRQRKYSEEHYSLWVWAQMTSSKTTSWNPLARSSTLWKNTRITWSLAWLMTLRYSSLMSDFFLSIHLIHSFYLPFSPIAPNIFNCIVWLQEMHRLGARRLVVVGIPPLGCMPLVKTLKDETSCVESYNQAAATFNSKIKEKLAILRTSLRLKTAYADIYGTVERAMNNPKQYGKCILHDVLGKLLPNRLWMREIADNLWEFAGFTVTTKGCCGSGTVEYAESCRGLSTCADPSKYLFWDAVHPSENMYKIIADDVVNSLDRDLLL